MACLACSAPKKLIKGVGAILFGINKTLAKPRLEICSNCPFNTLGFCEQCGCYIRAKVRLKEESCPIEKW